VAELARYDGVETYELAGRLGVPRIVAHDTIGSTMDVAHELGRAGAPDRTLVLADEQTEGRGRERREWRSPPGGVWFTLLARKLDAEYMRVVPLRAGLAAAQALDAVAGELVTLKWPNDLRLSRGKLGGILVEARWRGEFEWAAIGIGINRIAPVGVDAAGLGAHVTRVAVLERVVPPLLAALRRRGLLDNQELAAIQEREITRGRRISYPLPGVVRGVGDDGALLVEIAGRLDEILSGPIEFADAGVAGGSHQPTANGQ
jgi:BirA family biotin operon repressor/biotin-[acetyl-CoA-carboxylase] ligase